MLYSEKPDSAQACARTQAIFKQFGNPQNRLKIIAVTGTNGKTTTAHVLNSILNASGRKSCFIGTLGAYIGDSVSETGFTTPPPEILAPLLKKAADEGNEYAVMEVSSHAIAQKRVHGIAFKLGIFTNLSREHLDYHKTMREYADVKASLFGSCEASVINYEDEYKSDMAWMSNEIYYYGTNTEFCDFLISDISQDEDGCSFRVSGELGCDVRITLPGIYNIYNVTAAMSAAKLLGVDTEDIKASVQKEIVIPGRMERFICSGKTVYIDFAHTPDALEKALTALRKKVKGKLICVFGCGGFRDAGKRPEMARISEKYADFTVVTSDNPRGENPFSIILDIASGFSENAEYTVICDRKTAILYALGRCGENDTILLAGKGHERYIEDGTGKRPFSESDILKEYNKNCQ